MLRSDLAPAKGEVGLWLETLVAECRERLAVVLPLAASELDFIQRLNSAGEIAPELLTKTRRSKRSFARQRRLESDPPSGALVIQGAAA